MTELATSGSGDGLGVHVKLSLGQREGFEGGRAAGRKGGEGHLASFGVFGHGAERVLRRIYGMVTVVPFGGRLSL